MKCKVTEMNGLGKRNLQSDTLLETDFFKPCNTNGRIYSHSFKFWPKRDNGFVKHVYLVRSTSDYADTYNNVICGCCEGKGRTIL